MYASDIIPPKKGSIRQIKTKVKPKAVVEDEEPLLIEEEVVENTVYYSNYQPKKKRGFPKALLLLLLCVLVVAVVGYTKFVKHTTLTFEPKVTSFDVRERISAYVPDKVGESQADALPYTLVYISAKGENRNPFTPVAASSSKASAPASAITLKQTEIVATTTGDKASVYLVNLSNENVSLRATTRVEINGLTFSLPQAVTVAPTKNAGIFDINTKYRLPGFKGTSMYDSLYAVLVKDTTASAPAAPTASGDSPTPTDTGSTTALVPNEIISLLPDTSIALKKNTIYDNTTDQNAVVTIEKQDLIDMLVKKNPSFASYIEAFSPIKDFVTYKIEIIDYEYETSAETGRPVVFKRLQLEVTPIFDIEKAQAAFVEFDLDVVEKIAAQIEPYTVLDISNTPFWSKQIAPEGKVEAKVEDN